MQKTTSLDTADPLPNCQRTVDGTHNSAGEIKHYVDLEMTQGSKQVNLQFFLTNIGKHEIILGYPWFTAIQPNINWA